MARAGREARHFGAFDRKAVMLGIGKVAHLSRALSSSAEELNRATSNPEKWYEELILVDPRKPDKERTVVNVRGLMRRLQVRLYRRILLPKLEASPYSHGGIRGRSIKSYVEPHRGKRFVFTTDISNYYPSIHHTRVYRLFTREFRCSPDVARVCTQICTYKHHLALGLITSPILADQVLGHVDERIAAACDKEGLRYSRFVDDIAISAEFDLRRSGYPKLIGQILSDHGFRLKKEKNQHGRLSEGLDITGIRENSGHLDARRSYVEELDRQLEAAALLASGEDFDGPYYTADQILGRIRFVCWINPRRKASLMKKYRSIKWERVCSEARRQGLERVRKTIKAVSSSRGT